MAEARECQREAGRALLSAEGRIAQCRDESPTSVNVCVPQHRGDPVSDAQQLQPQLGCAARGAQRAQTVQNGGFLHTALMPGIIFFIKIIYTGCI